MSLREAKSDHATSTAAEQTRQLLKRLRSKFKRTADDRYQWDDDRGEAARPYRLWDAVAKANLRWRFFSDPKKAHLAAMIEVRWMKVGSAIEVYDCRTGRLLGQYVRKVDSIRFIE